MGDLLKVLKSPQSTCGCFVCSVKTFFLAKNLI